MFSTLLIVLPIFALILAGWVTRKIGVLGAAATTELNRFVVYLALPALLFDIVAHAHWADIWQPGFIAAFGLPSGVTELSEPEMQLMRHGARVLISGLPLVASLQIARVYGQALAMIADAEVRLVHLYVHEPLIRDGVPNT